MMPRMRRLVWMLLVVLLLVCGAGDGRAAVVRREVSPAAGAVTWTRTDSIYDPSGNRSSVVVTNAIGAQTRLDYLQWDRQNRLVGYAMFDTGRRCVFEAAYAYDHRARRVYRAERDERSGDPKIEFHREIKSLEERLGVPGLRLHSFILSATPWQELLHFGPEATREAFDASGVLFLEGGPEVWAKALLDRCGG